LHAAPKTTPKRICCLGTARTDCFRLNSTSPTVESNRCSMLTVGCSACPPTWVLSAVSSPAAVDRSEYETTSFRNRSVVHRTLPKLQIIFWVLPNLIGVAQFTRTNQCSSCENLRASRSLTHVSLSALYSVYTLRSLHSKIPALPLDLPL